MSKNILLIDENKLASEELEKVLFPWGYKVEVLEEISDSFDFNSLENVHLILMVLPLNTDTHKDFILGVRNLFKSNILPLVVVNEREYMDVVEEAIGCGANDYIEYPLNVSLALTRVNAQLAFSSCYKNMKELPSEEGKVKTQASDNEALSELKNKIIKCVHDINNPLAISIGYGQMLRENFDEKRLEKLLKSLDTVKVRLRELRAEGD